jgi:MOSC N-terminal beta barrel domain
MQAIFRPVDAGTVQRLRRWPVVSMGGEEVSALSIGPLGVGGDRVHRVVLEDGTTLTAQVDPRLAAWTAAYPFNLGAGLDPARPPFALVSDPAGRRTYRWGDPRLVSALERDLGRALRAEREISHGHVRIGDGPRCNLQLGLDAPEGAGIVFEHGVRLVVVAACERGVLARVAATGRIAEGERVRIETEGTSGFWTDGR